MKKLIEYLPIISAMLLFLGFINYTSFYRFFDIEIIHYLTSGELILSFLPLTVPILFLVIVVSLMVIIQIIPLPGDSKRNESNNNSVSIWTIFLASQSANSIKYYWTNKKTFGNIAILTLTILIFIIGIGIIAFFVLAPFVMLPLAISSQLFPDWDIGLVGILSVLWFLLLFDIIKVSEIRGKIQYAGWINLFFLVIVFIYFIFLSNKIEATDILNSKPSYSLKFEFDGKLVQTDSNFVYIGRTSEYIFLRNILEKTNSIYLSSEIKHFEILKLVKKKNISE